MKRILLIAAAAAMLSLFANDAQAACQKCNNNYTANAMCWALTGTATNQAEFDSCWEVQEFDEQGQVAFEYCDGTPAPSSCFTTGGGDGPKDPLNKDPGGDDGCTRTELGCPAQCSTCL